MLGQQRNLAMLQVTGQLDKYGAPGRCRMPQRHPAADAASRLRPAALTERVSRSHTIRSIPNCNQVHVSVCTECSSMGTSHKMSLQMRVIHHAHLRRAQEHDTSAVSAGCAMFSRCSYTVCLTDSPKGGDRITTSQAGEHVACPGSDDQLHARLRVGHQLMHACTGLLEA